MIQQFTSVQECEKVWKTFLTRDNEVANNLPNRILSYCPNDEAEAINKGILMLSQIGEDGLPTGFAFMTPPHRLVLSMPYLGEFEQLVNWLVKKEIQVPGVIAEKESGHGFARCWMGKSRGSYTVGHEMTIYELRTKARFPEIPPAGRSRVANLHDNQILAEWLRLFEMEANLTIKTKDPLELINHLIEKEEILVWENDDHELAGCARRLSLSGMGCCVNLVYTPKKMRRQGIASQLVAQVSEDFFRQIPDGYCCLFTDNANPTSNSIYQKIGYREVAQFVEIDLLDNNSKS